MPRRDQPPSSTPSPSSPGRSEEPIDAEWTEVAGAAPSPRSPEPPVDLAARVRGRRERRQKSGWRPRASPRPPPARCVFCQGPDTAMLLVPGLPLAVPICARCEKLSSLALRLFG